MKGVIIIAQWVSKQEVLAVQPIPGLEDYLTFVKIIYEGGIYYNNT